MEMVTPVPEVDQIGPAETDKFWREIGEMLATQPFAEVPMIEEVAHPSSSMLEDPGVARHQSSSSTSDLLPLQLRIPTIAQDPNTRGETVCPKPPKRRRHTGSGRVATTKRQRRERRAKAKPSGAMSTSSSLAMPLQSSASNPPGIAATIAPSLSSPLPPNQVLLIPQVDPKTTPYSDPHINSERDRNVACLAPNHFHC